jgi:hypothetical protein
VSRTENNLAIKDISARIARVILLIDARTYQLRTVLFGLSIGYWASRLFIKSVNQVGIVKKHFEFGSIPT